jgi:hypothetical protein
MVGNEVKSELDGLEDVAVRMTVDGVDCVAWQEAHPSNINRNEISVPGFFIMNLSPMPIILLKHYS